MILLYILGGIVLCFLIMIPSIILFSRIRYYFLIEKTGIYIILNEFINQLEFKLKSGYVGGNIEKKKFYSSLIKYDNFISPNYINVSGIPLDSKNEIPYYILSCSFEKVNDEWIILKYSDMNEEMENIMKEEYGESEEEK